MSNVIPANSLVILLVIEIKNFATIAIKQRGHIITECPTIPAQCPTQAFHATTGSADLSPPSTTTRPDVLTPEKVQQIVLSALSTLGIQGKSTSASTPWFVDSGASNHMTGSPEHLHNIHAYNGTQNIQIDDGNSLPISAIGDINPFFRNVFVSPGLAANLISVGQLVDNNCNVNFSRLVVVCRIRRRGK